MVDIVDVVGQVYNLPGDAKQALCRIFAEDSIKKGEDFIREGERGERLAFLKDGLLRSYYISPKGQEYNKHFFTAGSFVVPVTSLVTGQPSPVYIGALEDSAILVASYRELENLYAKHLHLNILGRKLVELGWIGKERRETQLIMLDARQRYRAFLEEFPGLEQRIPQYHIASYLGITPVQLSRIRGQKN